MTDRTGKPDVSPGPRDENKDRIQEDLVLIEMVQSGSISHWHAFVDKYAGLIFSVIRRQLFAEDIDEARTVFADVLEALYRGKLAEFRGRSALSTWLIVVSRGMALDHLRRIEGRRKMPKGFGELSPLEQDIFRLHNVEGLSFEVVLQTLSSSGNPLSAESLANVVIKIESMFDRHYLRRLEYEAKAPALHVASGRLLEFMQRTQLQHERVSDDEPDRALELKDLRLKARRIRELLSEFSEQEQSVMRMRFDEEKTARQISDDLGLGGPRRVYTIIEGVIRKIRNMLS